MKLKWHFNGTYIGMVFCAIFVGIVNVLFYSNKVIEYGLVILEIFILVLVWLSKGMAWYVSLYIVFMSNCLEFSGFVGTENFFGLKSIEFLGINLGVWLLLPIIINLFRQPVLVGELKYTQPVLYKFGIGLIGMNICALLTGLFNLVINDNGVRKLSGYMGLFVGEMYSYMVLPFVFFAAMIQITLYYKKDIRLISYALQAVLIANIFQTITSVLTKTYGIYGGVNTALMSTVYFLIPFSVLLYLDRENVEYPCFMTIIGLAGTLATVRYCSNGKLFLVIAIVAVIVVINAIMKKNPLIWGVLVICIFAFCIYGVAYVQNIAKSNVLFENKLNQALRLVCFWNKDWIESLPNSPRVRVEEIINVVFEFIKKPWYVLTGKGYLGTITDQTGYITSVKTWEGMYSEAEWTGKVFYSLHELASTFLVFGSNWIIYILCLLKETIKKYKSNIWLLIGAYWFVMLYGYSMTMSTFGIVALLYGFCNLEGINAEKESAS